MPAYEGQRFSPPAAVATVRVMNLDTASTLTDVAMLIDSGADVSVLPKRVSEALSLPQAESGFEVMAFDNTVRDCVAVVAAIAFMGKRFKGTFLVIDQDYGVLGRDILNHVVLLLNGPGLQWDSR
jgi:hypothetical protein